MNIRFATVRFLKMLISSTDLEPASLDARCCSEVNQLWTSNINLPYNIVLAHFYLKINAIFQNQNSKLQSLNHFLR